jgi:S-DNA-T family DNA segregation ATPase FtsK/SpoIIIE
MQTDTIGLPPLAVADDPDRQAQYPVGWDPAAGNLLVYGVVGSGTSTALAALALASAAAEPPDRLHLYVLDMGSGGLKPLEALPHTGAYIGPAERARQIRMIRVLRGELNARKAGGPGRGGHAGAPARWLVLIDNVGSLRAELEKDFAGLAVLDDLERIFADGPALGLHVLATGDRIGAMPSAWAALSRQKLLLRLADPGDYAHFDIPRNAVPAAVPGRALVVATRQVVQIAYPGEDPAVAVADIARRWIGRAAHRVPGAAAAGAHRGPATARGGSRSRDRHRTVVRPGRIRRQHPGTGRAQALRERTRADRGTAALRPQQRPARDSRDGAGRTAAADRRRVRPRRSPLRELPAPVIVCTDYTELDRFLDPVEGRALLLVDDADSVPDGLGVLDRWIAKAGPGRHVIAAGRNDGVRRQYGLWTQRVREGRCGVLLMPDHDLDSDLLGTALPRQHRMAAMPGRGYLVSDGAIDGVQLALAEALA